MVFDDLRAHPDPILGPLGAILGWEGNRGSPQGRSLALGMSPEYHYTCAALLSLSLSPSRSPPYHSLPSEHRTNGKCPTWPYKCMHINPPPGWAPGSKASVRPTHSSPKTSTMTPRRLPLFQDGLQDLQNKHRDTQGAPQDLRSALPGLQNGPKDSKMAPRTPRLPFTR